MGTQSILHGEAVVCSHAKKFIDSCRIELGMAEKDVVERIINGYVHSWLQELEVPLDSSYSAVAAAIRDWFVGGSRVS